MYFKIAFQIQAQIVQIMSFFSAYFQFNFKQLENF